MDDLCPAALNLFSSILRPLENDDIHSLVGLGITMLASLLVTVICAASENAFFSHRESDLEHLRDSSVTGKAIWNTYVLQNSNLQKTFCTCCHFQNICWQPFWF